MKIVIGSNGNGRLPNHPKRFVGDAEEHGIGGRRHEIGHEASGDTSESRCKPSDGMAAHGHERGSCQRNQNQITCIRRHTCQHAHKNNQVGNDRARSHLDELTDQRGHETGDFGSARTHQRDQRNGQGTETLKVRHK